MANGPGLPGGIGNFLNNQGDDYSNNPQKPKAYLNYILFDEQFNMVQSAIGYDPVGQADELKTHALLNLPITKSGYLYVYVSNETTNTPVYFDNLTVLHRTGPLLEEDDYYPFGLEMKMLGSKAAGKQENKKMFNDGTELNRDFDLNIYETAHRGYDPQTGRFNQIDKLSDIFHAQSPYNYCDNDPIAFNDPSGLSKKGSGFPDDEKADETTLQNVVVTPNSNRYQVKSYPSYMGGDRYVDTHFYDNVRKLENRLATGADIVTGRDRQSYVEGLEDGSLVAQAERNQAAIEEQEMLYMLFFTALTLPGDVVGICGAINKGSQFLKVVTPVGRGGFGWRTAISTALKSLKAGSFTKSTTALGRSTHNMYQDINGATKFGPSIFKEFRIPGVGRIDVLNNASKTIFELKTNNITEIVKGLKQLQKYNDALGGGYKTVLDLY